MPRLRLTLPSQTPWTKTPNSLFDHLLPELKDTELRVLLVVLRATTGWHREGRWVVLSYKVLMERTGRHSEAIAAALISLERRGFIHRSQLTVQRKPKSKPSQTEEQQYKES
jgi:hypothetical protein